MLRGICVGCTQRRIAQRRLKESVMRKWSCHIEVEAFKVEKIGPPIKAGFNCLLIGSNGECAHVTSEWVEKNGHHTGVYFVRNLETLEESYMCAEEFEGRYSIFITAEADTSGVIAEDN